MIFNVLAIEIFVTVPCLFQKNIENKNISFCHCFVCFCLMIQEAKLTAKLDTIWLMPIPIIWIILLVHLLIFFNCLRDKIDFE